MLVRVMLVMNGPALLSRIRRLLPRRDCYQGAVAKGDDLVDALHRESADLIVLDEERLPTPSAGTIAALRELPDEPDLIVLSRREDAEQRAALLAAGCCAVVPRDLENPSLRAALGALLERRRETMRARLEARVNVRKASLTDFASASPVMQKFIGVVRRVVATDSSILILGETGVGKEWLARSIHGESPRAEAPFVAVNCGAMPEALLESELFGHEEGAFTGATRPHRGFFEIAHGGTIFLDEIGEMPMPMQVKLLRVLQDHEIRRVGSERSIEVDVRVIAATNRDLETEVEAKRFRQDLYYRLAIVTLTIPPLRERREDIPSLLESYLTHFRRRFVRDVASFSDRARSALTRYRWPGNVRELVNVIERATLLCESDRIDLVDLPETVAACADASLLPEPISDEAEPEDGAGFDAGEAGLGVGDDGAGPPMSGGDALEGDVTGWEELFSRPLREARERLNAAFERAYLAHHLEATHGRVGETARRAGIQPRSLFEKMRVHGLRKEDFRARRG